MGSGPPGGKFDDPTGISDSRLKKIKNPADAAEIFANELFNRAWRKSLKGPGEAPSGPSPTLPVDDLKLFGDTGGAVRNPVRNKRGATDLEVEDFGGKLKGKAKTGEETPLAWGGGKKYEGGEEGGFKLPKKGVDKLYEERADGFTPKVKGKSDETPKVVPVYEPKVAKDELKFVSPDREVVPERKKTKEAWVPPAKKDEGEGKPAKYLAYDGGEGEKPGKPPPAKTVYPGKTEVVPGWPDEKKPWPEVAKVVPLEEKKPWPEVVKVVPLEDKKPWPEATKLVIPEEKKPWPEATKLVIPEEKKPWPEAAKLVIPEEKKPWPEAAKLVIPEEKKPLVFAQTEGKPLASPANVDESKWLTLPAKVVVAEEKKGPPSVQPTFSEEKKWLTAATIGISPDERKTAIAGPSLPAIDERKALLIGAAQEEKKGLVVGPTLASIDERKALTIGPISLPVDEKKLLVAGHLDERRALGMPSPVVTSERKDLIMPFAAAVGSHLLARSIADANAMASQDKRPEVRALANSPAFASTGEAGAANKLPVKELLSTVAGAIVLGEPRRELQVAGLNSQADRQPAFASGVLAAQSLMLDKASASSPIRQQGNVPGGREELIAAGVSAIARGEKAAGTPAGPPTGRMNIGDGLFPERSLNQPLLIAGQPLTSIGLPGTNRPEGALNNPTGPLIKWEPTATPVKQPSEPVRVVVGDLRPIDLGPRPIKNSQDDEIPPIEVQSNNTQTIIANATNTPGTTNTTDPSASGTTSATGGNQSSDPTQPGSALPNVQIGGTSAPDPSGNSPVQGTNEAGQTNAAGQSVNVDPLTSNSSDPCAQTGQATAEPESVQVAASSATPGQAQPLEQVSDGSGSAVAASSDTVTLVDFSAGEIRTVPTSDTSQPTSSSEDPSTQSCQAAAEAGLPQVAGSSATPGQAQPLEQVSDGSASAVAASSDTVTLVDFSAGEIRTAPASDSSQPTSSSESTSNQTVAQIGPPAASASNSDLNNAPYDRIVQNQPEGPPDAGPFTPGPAPAGQMQGSNMNVPSSAEIGPFLIPLGNVADNPGRQNTLLGYLGLDLENLLLSTGGGLGTTGDAPSWHASSGLPVAWTSNAYPGLNAIPPVDMEATSTSSLPEPSGPDSGYFDNPSLSWRVPYGRVMSGPARSDEVPASSSSDVVSQSEAGGDPRSGSSSVANADGFSTGTVVGPSQRQEAMSDGAAQQSSGQQANEDRIISLVSPDRSNSPGGIDSEATSNLAAPSISREGASIQQLPEEVGQASPGPATPAETSALHVLQIDPSQIEQPKAPSDQSDSGSAVVHYDVSGEPDRGAKEIVEALSDQVLQNVGKPSDLDAKADTVLLAADVDDMLRAARGIGGDAQAESGNTGSSASLMQALKQVEEQFEPKSKESDEQSKEKGKDQSKDKLKQEQEDEEDPRLAALMLLEEARRIEDERHELYMVQKGDTLESIASSKLGDVFLAALIYDLNADKIPVEHIDGAVIYVLKTKVVLLLPSRRQIREWAPVRMSFWGKYQTGTATVRVAPKKELDPAARKRRENIEQYLGPLFSRTPQPDPRSRVIVRLGDTLISIATNHPALNDSCLWPLLAEVNDLPTDCDELGVPVAVLRRGDSLLLPERWEIDQFKRELKLGVKVNAPRQGIKAAIVQHGMESVNTNKTEHLAETKADNPKQLEQEAAQTMMINSFIERLGDSCRIVKSTPRNVRSSEMVSRLEVLSGERWLPVVTYEIHDRLSIRHEHNPDGQWVSTSIDLPASAASDLATNDLRLNWQSYMNRFLETCSKESI